MRNPYTDGELDDESAPLGERLLSGAIACTTLLGAYHLDLLSTPRIRYGFPALLFMACLCIWYPAAGGWTFGSTWAEAEASDVATRIIGWSGLIFMAASICTMLVYEWLWAT